MDSILIEFGIVASESQLLRAPRRDTKCPSVREQKYPSHLSEVSIINAVEEQTDEHGRRSWLLYARLWIRSAWAWKTEQKGKAKATHGFRWRGWWCCARRSALGLKPWQWWWCPLLPRCWRNAPDRCSGLSSTCKSRIRFVTSAYVIIRVTLIVSGL